VLSNVDVRDLAAYIGVAKRAQWSPPVRLTLFSPQTSAPRLQQP